MARVRREADADLGAGAGRHHRVVALVILHIAVALLGIGDVVLAEFVEDKLVVLAQNIGEHVEAAAVSHAHDDLLHAVARTFLHNLVEDRDDRFATLERKALLADVAGVEEFLEHLALEQVAEHALFLGVGQRVLAQTAFLDPAAEPAADGVILDVHVLDADVAAVGLAQQLDDGAQRHAGRGARPVNFEFAVEIGSVSLT